MPLFLFFLPCLLESGTSYPPPERRRLNHVDSLLKVSLPGFIISTTLSLKIIHENACSLACHYFPSLYHACCKLEPPTLRLNHVDSLSKVSWPGFIISTTLSLKIIAPNACSLACHYSPSLYHACCKVEPCTLRLNRVDSLLKVSLPGFIISTTLSLKIIAPNACSLACHYSPSLYHPCCKVEPRTLRLNNVDSLSMVS